MTWTPEHRRRYAPAIDRMVRTHAITRLAATIDAIDPPCAVGHSANGRLVVTITEVRS